MKRDAENDRVSHAYLLDAPDRLAGALTMRMFAALVLGGGDFRGAAGGFVFAGKHPDAAELPGVSIQGAVREQLAVADIDALSADVYKRPSRGDYKFYLINYAETMSALCQNKLLKTLEEPPAGVCILLNCRSRESVLPTVASRCRTLTVRPFDPGLIGGALAQNGSDHEKASLAAALSGGSLTKADAFYSDPKLYQIYRLSLDVLKNTKSSKDVLDAVASLSGIKDRLADVLDYFEAVFRDIAVYHAGLENHGILQNGAADIESLSQSCSAAAAGKILPFLGKIRRRLSLNANQNSLLDELMFTITEYRAKYR